MKHARTASHDREIARIRRVIAEAIPSQGPPEGDHYSAAVDVMRALAAHSYQVIRLDESGELVGFEFKRPGRCSLCGTDFTASAYVATGVCEACPHVGRCHEARQRAIDLALGDRAECSFHQAFETPAHQLAGGTGR